MDGMKQAHNSARQMVKALRAFEATEEVLGKSLIAAQEQVAVEERVRVLRVSAAKWEAAVVAAQKRYAQEQALAHDVAELARDRHETAMAEMADAVEKAVIDAARATAKTLSEGEARIKALTAECRSLEGRRDDLEQELEKAREARAVMLEKLGVKNG